MKKIRPLTSIMDLYKKYNQIQSNNKIYKVLNRVLNIFTIVIVCVTAMYVCLTYNTQILFTNVVSHKNYKFYYNQQMSSNIVSVIEEVESKLSKSEFNNIKVDLNIFIFDKYNLYSFFSLEKSSFATTSPFSKNIFINVTDMKTNKVSSSASDFTRPLSEVLTHEITHVQIITKKGVIETKFAISNWKQEGYCEYVAGGSTIDYSDGIKLIEQRIIDAPGLEYFRYYIYIKYLIEIKRLNMDTIFQMQINENDLEEEIVKNIHLMKNMH